MNHCAEVQKECRGGVPLVSVSKGSKKNPIRMNPAKIR